MSLQSTLWRRARLSDGLVAAIQQSNSQKPAAHLKRRRRRLILITLGALGVLSAALGLWLWTRPEEPALPEPITESVTAAPTPAATRPQTPAGPPPSAASVRAPENAPAARPVGHAHPSPPPSRHEIALTVVPLDPESGRDRPARAPHPHRDLKP